jgi:transcriptional regulator with XRE-family HTH domain
MGISRAAVSKHENGKQGLSREFAERYAKLFKVSIAELFTLVPDEEAREAAINAVED